mmetsp:Transcript_16107/g.38199  ORF Transcript_16107/g.38199 Transcript_16107/m.38199 type:complete len:204 (-) Transcript_16107:942-1553(-)
MSSSMSSSSASPSSFFFRSRIMPSTMRASPGWEGALRPPPGGRWAMLAMTTSARTGPGSFSTNPLSASCSPFSSSVASRLRTCRRSSSPVSGVSAGLTPSPAPGGMPPSRPLPCARRCRSRRASSLRRDLSALRTASAATSWAPRPSSASTSWLRHSPASGRRALNRSERTFFSACRTLLCRPPSGIDRQDRAKASTAPVRSA